MSDSVWPHKRQPTRLPRPWDSPGKNSGVGCHFLLQCMKLKSDSEVAQLCPTHRDTMYCSLQTPPAMGLSRQEYWSGLPLSSPNRMLHSHLKKKEILLFATTWMDLEGIMLIAVSQTGKDKYHRISFIYGSYQSVQSFSHVCLFVTPWTAVRQASLSITNSWI